MKKGEFIRRGQSGYWREELTAVQAAAPGKYRLRAVVQEEVDGKMASSTQVVEVK